MTSTGVPSSYSCGAIVRPEERSYFLIVKYSPSTAWISTARGREYGVVALACDWLSIAQRVPAAARCE